MGFFQAEPELVSELVSLVQAEQDVPEPLRALAVRALAVQLLDRSRHTAVISAISASGQGGLLSMLLQKSINSLITSGSAATSAASGSGRPQVVYGVEFVDAMLSVVGALVSSTTGCNVLAGSGVIQALLPMLQDYRQDSRGGGWWWGVGRGGTIEQR